VLGVDVIASKRYRDGMSDARRATVYFEPDVHRALKLKAAASDRSVSDMVNEAVRLALAEDAEDLAAFDERASEPEIAFDSFVKSLKRSGKI
jgi:plasmid stability protein